MKIDPTALDIQTLAPLFTAFEEAGARLLYVGGCIRNAVMGGAATDIDLTSDAVPDQMRRIAQAHGIRVVDTGEDHGTLTFLLGGKSYEITTFRQDVTTDGRHAEVVFGTSLEQDAARRDFTMNALYAEASGQVIDPLDGLADAQARRLRFIGEPQARIAEDYLRILRFFRFWAWYGDSLEGVDAQALAACAALQSGLDRISKERIGAELLRLLAAADPAPALAAMEAAGILGRVLPGASARSVSLLVDLEREHPPDALRRVACLGGEAVQERLRLSNVQARQVEALRYHGQNTTKALAHGYALGAAQGWSSWLLRAAWMENRVTETEQEAVRRGAQSVCPVSAADLMPKHQGPALGEALKRAQDIWIARDMQITKDEILVHLDGLG
ncbi:CCA tRNA nucleotidyltransferase [Planktomarina temperata]|nr:CCA tRNA nucleotidyltransferase [Planktomarina temperata]